MCGSASRPADPVRGARLPPGVVGGYWTYWAGTPLRALHPAFNVLYLFHAEPVLRAPPGTVRWPGPTSSDVRHDLAAWRRRGGIVLLTVGGAGAQVPLPDRAATNRLLASISEVHSQLGGFDGVDWNTYEGDPAPPTSELIWASHELKRVYGPDFAITTPPAPLAASDLAHCRSMLDAGALDLVAPQCYDVPGLDARDIAGTISWWARGLGQPDRLAVGFGLAGAVAAHPSGDVPAAWRAALARVRGLRGAYVWDVAADAAAGWAFADKVGGSIHARCAPDAGGRAGTLLAGA
jgi:hypothetical protein